MVFTASIVVLCLLADLKTSIGDHNVLSIERTKRLVRVSCSRLQHTCASGHCIPSYSVCDGQKDCTDGSEETREACRAINIRCPSSAFECAYGACIDSELRCDGKADCADGSDEHQCQQLGFVSNCGGLEFACASSQCIPSYSVCDGPKECSDGSDETRAACRATNISCPLSAFQCVYGACVDKELRCDGKADCADGSDEHQCQRTNCSAGTFQCNNGKCIHQFAACDGREDCSDGSDETRDSCKNLKCPPSSYQCNYGACLERSVKCNGYRDCPDGSDELGCPAQRGSTSSQSTNSGGCWLPEYPQHGAYGPPACLPGDQRYACRNIPGTYVPSNWIIKYTCDDNYDLTSGVSAYSICDNGIWMNPLGCVKMCPPLQSLSMDVRCVYRGQEVACDRPMRLNTTATAECKQHYRKSETSESATLLCINGEWDRGLLKCIPVCGVQTKPGLLTALIRHGTPTQRGEFPWLTALYLKNNHSDKWEQNCGGTLISPHIVLTAAHCLTPNTNLINPKDIKVGLGKYYRDYYRHEDLSVLADVRKIVIPNTYFGASTSYAQDIGLLDLTTSVQVTAYIMPACVDWASFYHINRGDVGHVAGWGRTENNTASDVILSTQLAYTDPTTCVKKIRQASQHLLTPDKFCISSHTGGQVYRGDSGGGLTFVRNDLHFVYGIVSTLVSEAQTNLETYLFTELTYVTHHKWLSEHKAALDQAHLET